MTMLAFPWLCTTVAAIVAVGWWVGHDPSPSRSRTLAVAVASFVTVLGLGYAGGLDVAQTPLRDPVWHAFAPRLGIDTLTSQIVSLSGLLALMVLFGAPRTKLLPRDVSLLLFQLAGWLLSAMAEDLASFVAGWVTCGLIVVARNRVHQGPGASRLPTVYLLAAIALLATTFAAIHIVVRDQGVRFPLPLDELGPALTAGGPLRLLAGGLLVAIWLRSGIIPFHSWIPALSRSAGASTAALATTSELGILALIRVGVPLFPETMVEHLPLLGTVALLSALYAAALSVAATELRRWFGWLVTSQSALLLVGLEETTHNGLTGGLILWLALALALTGLSIAIEAIESRVGTVDLRRFTGLAGRAPWLGGAFILLGLSSVGLPGTLGFVGEDLLVHGAIETYPRVGIAIVATTALNAFSIVRSFIRIFYGPTAPSLVVDDATPRERIALFLPLALLLLFGLYPQAVVTSRAAAAEDLAAKLTAAALP